MSVVFEFSRNPERMEKWAQDPLSPDVDRLADWFYQDCRLEIDGTTIFELPVSLLSLCFYGLWLVENLESDRVARLALGEGSYALQMERHGETVTAREEYTGAEASQSREELVEAWRKFANEGRQYLLEQVPLLIHNPIVGPWFQHFPGPSEFPWAVFRNVRLKRIYDPPSDDDGYRVLSTRYWPRGVPKAAVDEYTTKTAPSRALLSEFKHEGLSWEDYVPRYLDEMTSPEAMTEIARLAKLAQSKAITLMCVCEDERRCHRSLLRDLIIEADR